MECLWGSTRLCQGWQELPWYTATSGCTDKATVLIPVIPLAALEPSLSTMNAHLCPCAVRA
eukprot:1154303-Pelagomonas_calceolata.AAC.2